MSTLLAHAARTQKVGILAVLAVLAAFAAYAGLGLRAENARADVDGQDVQLHGGCPTDGGPVVVGDLCVFAIVVDLSAPTAGDLIVKVTLDPSYLGDIQAVDAEDLGGSSAICKVTGDDDHILTCTFDGPLDVDTQSTLFFGAIVKGVGEEADLVDDFTAEDSKSNDGAVDGEDNTEDTDLYGAQVNDFTKEADDTTVSAGATVEYTITFSLLDDSLNVPAVDWELEDTLPGHFASITSVAVDNDDVDGDNVTCSKSGLKVTCESDLLEPGDQVVITITAVLRSADSLATGAAPNIGYESSGNVRNVAVASWNSEGGEAECSTEGLDEEVFAELDCDASANVAATATATVTATEDITVSVPAPARPLLCEGLYHVGMVRDATTGEYVPTLLTGGNDTNGKCTKAGLRDVPNNVIGADHWVCLVGRVLPPREESDEPTLGVQPPNTTNYRWWIQTVSGSANVQGTATDIMTPGPYISAGGEQFTKYANGEDLECVRWYSTGQGEQNIVVVDDRGRVIADWADGPSTGGVDKVMDGFISSHTPLVKEWNILEPTSITASSTLVKGGEAGDIQGTNHTIPALFNPATGELQGSSPIWYEHVIASHSDGLGKGFYEGIGANITIKAFGCGAVEVWLDDFVPTNIPYSPFSRWIIEPGETVTGVSNGAPIRFRLHASAFDDGHTSGAKNCDQSGSMTWVTFNTAYPNFLGSATPPKPAEETIKVTWTIQPAQKQVFLAWAGQRIILEHDWRLPPGDKPDSVPDSSANGNCPFYDGFGREDGLQVSSHDGKFVYWLAHWVKGGGPGNFISGLGAAVHPDEAFTPLIFGTDIEGDAVYGNNQVNDAPGRPQSACISRVLYESEQPGQVDIELFSGSVLGPDLAPFTEVDFDQWWDWNFRSIFTPDQTKVAFVVYYMKLNTVATSLVTQVSKPSHNGSVVADYAPGNPWDASKDDADNAADWNVSKDILVRIRVTGWFINENPSGRAADTSNPLNVLPANRWVMPDDWALLAGGPADPADGTDARGTAEEFRPYYDIMIAPNNAAGIALTTPTGASNVLSALVVANAANGTASFQVTAGIPAGTSLRIGAAQTAATVSSFDPVTGFLTISPALSAVPAAGTAIFVVNGTPFEGPFSLVDLPGLCALGSCGAALANVGSSFVRDTILRDGDVDRWDAPMPPALVSVKLRGTGFLKQVWKEDVYYNGTPNVPSAQTYPNPFYFSNIPDSPYIPAVVAGGGYLWDSWGDDGPAALSGLGSDLQFVTSGAQGDGPYHFWGFVRTDRNAEGIGEALSAADKAELAAIRGAYGDDSITRDAVVYTDNHGEAMVTANGDFKTDLSACASNVLGGGKHCKPGDVVGKATITATADYPDFRGKHFPVQSNAATVNWTWGGYKDVTVEAGEDPQFKYVVFHAMDRDGYCAPVGGSATPASVHLHSVYSRVDEKTTIGTNDPVETVDFLIDSGQGIIIGRADGGSLNLDGNRQFATGLRTYSVAENNPAVTGIKEFPLSSLAAAGATDECQAWIKVSNSLLTVVNVLVFAKDDEGTIGFDRVIDLQTTTKLTLNFRWSLVTWSGADNIKVSDALAGTGANDAGNDISAEVTAIYGWEATAQDWLGYFPAGVSVPGANDLVNLKKGSAYWIAIKGPAAVEWTIATNVG